MMTGKHIENARKHANIPVYVMCDVMCLCGEQDYMSIVKGHVKPTTYQQIMLFILFEGYPESMGELCV